MSSTVAFKFNNGIQFDTHGGGCQTAFYGITVNKLLNILLKLKITKDNFIPQVKWTAPIAGFYDVKFSSNLYVNGAMTHQINQAAGSTGGSIVKLSSGDSVSTYGRGYFSIHKI